VDDWRNKGKNQAVPRIKWKWKYNLSESVSTAKAMLRGKFIDVSAYIKKTKQNRDISNQQPNDTS
jgi:hypothetical protein